MKRALFLFLIFSAFASRAQVVLNSGKTFDNTPIYFAKPPILRSTAEDSLNGKPLYDVFLLVKAKLNGIYDIKGGLQESSTFNMARVNVFDDNNTPRFSMDMHQSQVRFRTQRETKTGTFTGYLEADFWGGNNVFRLRHLWFEYKFIKFGQDWSFFGDKEVWPNIFDWDGPSSGVWRREPQLVFFKEVIPGLRLEAGMEHPGFELTGSDKLYPGIPVTISADYQNVPDFILALNRKFPSGNHIRFTSIYRDLKYLINNTPYNVNGYGFTFSGLIKTNEQFSNNFQWQVVAGKGISTYIVSYSGLNLDAVATSPTTVKAIPAAGGWVTYEFYLNRHWHMNVVAGYSQMQVPAIFSFSIPGALAAVNTSIDSRILYGAYNIMYDPIDNLTLGVELNVGGKMNQYNGLVFPEQAPPTEVLDADRDAIRISFGGFFNF